MEKLWDILSAIAAEYGIARIAEDSNSSNEIKVTRSHAAEICRYGGFELHGIAALVGGVAAQEAVKIIAKQYVPLDNTFIYNGICGCAATYQF